MPTRPHLTGVRNQARAGREHAHHDAHHDGDHARTRRPPDH
ncbi:hypothetical protein ABT120_58955 [Nonomuraea angiospora]